MPTGVVQEIGRTGKGAPFLVIDGQRYYTSKCQTPPTGIATGLRIEFTAEPFGDAGRDGKRPMGLVTWKSLLNGAGQPQTASTITELNLLQSVSNVVGNACAAGSVKTPEELEKWFVAAHRGFLNMAKEETPRTPGEDDELPESFYQGLPPGATGKSNSPPW